ncbi:MAG TPA: sulfurtransferase [Fimbriimonadaceae bacterium]|nr:sulfurtransferase [Fimbriimonadaceae bacterium]
MPNPTQEISTRGYAAPEALVSTDWVAAHKDDSDVVLIESNEDPLLFGTGHIPGAVEVDWTRDLNDPITRDYLQSEGFSRLMSRIGATPESTIVFYGDKNNWWACYAAWVFHLFGHTNYRIMDGGRLKWQKEHRPMTKEIAHPSPTQYPLRERDDSQIRALRNQVFSHLSKKGKLIDVRSPEEYSGERLHMEAYPNEGALRGGHIPSAKNVPWAKAIHPEDGTFLDAAGLKALYEGKAGLSPSDDVIVYCRIGERSSHTWFVLHYLLGYPSVRNYDGSWTEWGNLVGAPIER